MNQRVLQRQLPKNKDPAHAGMNQYWRIAAQSRRETAPHAGMNRSVHAASRNARAAPRSAGMHRA